MQARPRIALVLLLLVVGTSLSCGADEPKTSGIRTDFDLVYAKAGDTELKLDLARPSGDGPFPALLVIHGGGWAGGNKSEMRPLLLECAKRGYVAVSPQYRFSAQSKFPAQVHDVKAAVRWLKGHAAEYHVKPDRVGAVGFSAGAHLALLLGMTGPSDGLEGDAPQDAPGTQVQAVVSYSGPTDLAADDLPQFSRNLVNDLLGGTPKEKPEAVAKASPVTFASKGDAPVLVFQGTNDPLVPHTQAVKLADALTKAGVPGRVELLLGVGHGYGHEELTHSLETTFVFFDKHLK